MKNKSPIHVFHSANLRSILRALKSLPDGPLLDLEKTKSVGSEMCLLNISQPKTEQNPKVYGGRH